MYRKELLFFLLFSAFCVISIGCRAQESSAPVVQSETSVSIGETGPLSAGETGVPGETTVKETVPPPYIPPLRPGLSLMPTAYVRMSPKHLRETGINFDFVFSCYIGELYEYIQNKHSFFDRWYLFLFGIDAKWSFSRPVLDEFTHVLLNLSGIERSLPLPRLRPELERGLGGGLAVLNRRFPLPIRECEEMPTIAIGTSGWLFRSMGSTFELTEMGGEPWIQNFYIVGSKQFGDYGFHLGYVYGTFIKQFLGQIQSIRSLTNHSFGNINDDTHTIFIGFDMNIPWGTRKFSVEYIYCTPQTFLINTSTGLWGFELAFLKVPNGFSVIGYWSFRSNIFTFF